MIADRELRWAKRERDVNIASKLLVGLWVVLMFCVVAQILDNWDRDAMAQCQAKGFSYDTCHYELNR